MLLSNPHILNSASNSRNPRIISQHLPKFPTQRTPITQVPKTLNPRTFLSIYPSIYFIGTRPPFLVCKDSTEVGDLGSTVGEEVRMSGDGGGSGNNWTTSVLLFGLWAGLMFYVFCLAPDQTPNRDVYFVQKLLYLKGDDGYRMNEVLVALWNIMGLWPVIYSMLLLPAGRSEANLLFRSAESCGVFHSLIYTMNINWNTLTIDEAIRFTSKLSEPADSVTNEKAGVNDLESTNERLPSTTGYLKCIQHITVSAMVAAAVVWMSDLPANASELLPQMLKLIKEITDQVKLLAKDIHVMSVDFLLLSSFAPFWIYNDMTARRWVDKGLWLLPVSLIPLLGPALYVALRPQLAELPTRFFPDSTEKE